MKGVPESLWKERQRDADGKVSLPIDGPAYAIVMQTAEDAGARERLWRAKTNEGGADNLKLLARIEQLRLEQARLFGFASYAEFVLRRRMVETGAHAAKFLDEVHAAVADEDAHDVTELRQAKARHLGQTLEATKLQRWDTMFYSERILHERFAVDDEAFRPYFPPQESLRFVMRVAEKMFGVRYDKGRLFIKREADPAHTFWQGPSIGPDTGANPSRIFSLVYNLKEPGLIYRRYPGVEGSAYFVGGLGVTYQRAEGIVLTPVRAGVGLRLGANVGYMNISRKRRILPL